MNRNLSIAKILDKIQNIGQTWEAECWLRGAYKPIMKSA
jgi:hypothetical protein